MATIAHQWLVAWIARKMTSDGYIVAGFDGPTPHGWVWNARPRPTILENVRPDIWAMEGQRGEVAVGEAKLFDDIDTRHTREQLRVFGHLRERRALRRCQLYLAVPRSGVFELDRVLRHVGMLGAEHVKRLHVPDCFLKDTFK